MARFSDLGEVAVSAPGGLCGSCGRTMQWTFIDGELMVKCFCCFDLFGVEVGTEGAGVDLREGREAVMPDGRPTRPLSHIAMDRS